MRNSVLAGVAAGAFLISAAGAAMALPDNADAADPTPTPVATSAAPTATSAAPTSVPSVTPANPSTPPTPSGTDPATGQSGGLGGHRGHGLHGDDLTVAAKALGMTDAELTAELQSGKTAADVAKARNVDVAKVIAAIVAADKAEIAAEVKAGTLTAAQADARLANLEQHATDEVNGTGTGGGRGGHGGMSGSDITDAAKVLGMTDAELTAELQAGKSVADVAKAEGVDLAKVIDAMVAADTAKIEAAVKAGTMTQAQADARLTNLTAHVTEEVNTAGPGGGRGGHGRGHGDLDGDGRQPAASPTTGSGTGTGA